MPNFQVVGDKVFLVTNGDIFDPREHLGNIQGRYLPLWSGFTSAVNLSGWTKKQRVFPPENAVEPKLQIVGNYAYYEYFAQDRNGTWQIWTARSKVDGTRWVRRQRSENKIACGYAAEQEDNIQVVGNKIYYFYPHKDNTCIWQTWTAASATDGSNFVEKQRSKTTFWPLNFQIVGDSIYWQYIDFGSGHNINHETKDVLLLAKSNRDGSNWTILKTIDNAWSGSFFVVNANRIYWAYTQLDRKQQPHFYTSTMDLQGKHFNAIPRDFHAKVNLQTVRMQIVGDTIYYAITTQLSNLRNRPLVNGKIGYSIWTAHSRIDGSGWVLTHRSSPPPDIRFSYKDIQVIGGKMYYGVQRYYPDVNSEPGLTHIAAAFASEGSNIVNKGDAYGLGATSSGLALAFINAGQDYLFHGETPTQVAGGTTNASMDQKWHYVVMTYDKKAIRLYIDGSLQSASRYNSTIGNNPFPLMIGDGFLGIIQDVTIYRHVLTQSEILGAYRSHT